MANSDDGPSELAIQDEILQVMYWLRGEHLADEVTAADLLRFSASPEPVIQRVLDRLCRLGLLRPIPSAGPARYALSVQGAREAGRRFADEFADMTKPGHGACEDPDCDCHATGNLEHCRHR